MKPFHIMVHAAPLGAVDAERVPFGGGTLTRLLVRPEQLQRPLDVSFEELSDRLARLPRMFLEPDGSFVWVGGTPSQPLWQIDGLLFDRAGKLQYLELKGNCSAKPWDQLVAALSVDADDLVVQYVEPAYYVAAAEFRRYQFGADPFAP